MSGPAYRSLVESGALERRAEAALELLQPCRVCPRRCGAERLAGAEGACRTGRLVAVAAHFPHHGEEDCLRGSRGSGTIFFCGCNLLCPFCQNWETSHECEGEPLSAERLAEMMLELEAAGCHNINWVTPTHVVPQALEALAIAARAGLSLPIVYNSGGYDAVETLRLLEGVVDIYMPDFKFWDAAAAGRILGVPDYPEAARRAIREMHRQVGDLVIDGRGLATRGLLVRHLVLPNGVAGTPQVAAWLASEISQDTFLNVMPQYRPAGLVAAPAGRARFAELARPIEREEFFEAVAAARAAGLRRFAR